MSSLAFEEKRFAYIFLCKICVNIPTEAVMLSNCHHVFSEHCLQLWLACNGVCPTCRQCVDLGEDILPLHQLMLAVFDLLTISHKYSENRCTEKLKINQIHDHENSCKFRKGKKQKGSYQKVKLCDVLCQYHEHGRLQGLYTALSDFYETLTPTVWRTFTSPLIDVISFVLRCFRFFKLVHVFNVLYVYL